MKNISDINNLKANKYFPGIILVLILLVSAVLLEWFNEGHGINIPGYPVSVIIGLSLIVIVILCHVFFKNSRIFRILTSGSVTYSLLILFILLILAMKLIKQNPGNPSPFLEFIGLNHLLTSYVYYLSATFLLVVLGLEVLRRINSFSIRNTGLVLIFTGLWILAFTGSFGTRDLLRLNMSIYEGQLVWFGFNSRYKAVELPFTIKLLDFRMKEYPAKILVVDEKDPDYEKNIKNYIFKSEPGKEIKIKDYNVKLLEFLPEAVIEGTGYKSSDDSLSCQAALLSVKNEKKNISFEGWISTGNHQLQPDYINLESGLMVAMTIPEPKEILSEVEISTASGISDTVVISVEKPVKVKGYRLYQSSYDKEQGKHSRISIIKAIKYPWLPHVYAGIILLIAGSVLSLWHIKAPKK